MTRWTTIFSCLLLAATVASAGDWRFGAAVGRGHGRIVDNIARIPDDDVKIPTLFDEGGRCWSLSVDRLTVSALHAGLELTAWHRDGASGGGPHMALAAIDGVWIFGPDLELRVGVGLGLGRITYLEQGLETTDWDTGMAVSSALQRTFDLRGGWGIAPRLQWYGFSSRSVEVWAASTSILLGVTWSPKEKS